MKDVTQQTLFTKYKTNLSYQINVDSNAPTQQQCKSEAKYLREPLVSVGTARIVHHKHHVYAVRLNELHEKGSISDRIEAHALHVIGHQLTIL